VIFKDSSILSKYDNFFRISSEKTCQNAEPGFPHLWVSWQLSASALAYALKGDVLSQCGEPTLGSADNISRKSTPQASVDACGVHCG